MSSLATGSLSLILAILAVVGFGPQLAARLRSPIGERLPRPRVRPRLRREPASLPDPGRALRAERRAERLLRSVIGPEAYEAYRALGFLHLYGPPGAGGKPDYGYLIYPHRPIVSFDAVGGELLSEYCVTFGARRAGPVAGERLPDADDLLAKWMALRADERRLLGEANMHLPGRQHDPAHLRRDLHRLAEWEGRSEGVAPTGVAA